MMFHLPATDHILMAILFFLVAAIYSSVGHAGASGYSAVMAFLGVAPALMRSTSLSLNLVVGSIGLYRFQRVGLVQVRKVLPFLLTSMPSAYFSAKLEIQKKYFYLALGLFLFISAIRFFVRRSDRKSEFEIKEIPPVLALFFGGVIGFFSGLTGTGGAIFFTPLLLKMRWADARSAAGWSVLFVLANSVFALTGILGSSQFFEAHLMGLWIVSAVGGAFIGTHLGTSRFSNVNIERVLGVVLVIAAIKLVTLSAQS